jgi:hypothetical protein
MSGAIHIQKAVNAGHTEITQQINNLYDTDVSNLEKCDSIV